MPQIHAPVIKVQLPRPVPSSHNGGGNTAGQNWISQEKAALLYYHDNSEILQRVIVENGMNKFKPLAAQP